VVDEVAGNGSLVESVQEVFQEVADDGTSSPPKKKKKKDQIVMPKKLTQKVLLLHVP